MNNSLLNSNSRILVVGTSGAGKSTLAGQLSLRLDLQDIELDALFWGPNWTQAATEIFRERIEKAISVPGGWVIHGNYNKVQDLTLGKADTLIWLDYSRYLVFWRVVKRSIFRVLSKEDLWAGNRESFRKTFMSKESIILWSIQTYAQRKQYYEQLIQSSEFPNLKVVRFRNPKELNKFLAAL